MVASAKAVLTKEIIVAVDVLADKMVEMFVELSPSGFPAHPDGVYAYGLEVFNLGLLYHGFHDAIRDGDGDRVIIYWKALLIIFRTSNCHNYSKKALLLLVQQQNLARKIGDANEMVNVCK